MTAASSSSFKPFHAGIAPLYRVPLTSISPAMPCRRMLTSTLSSPSTHSDPASGGNTPSMPIPVAWWQAAHLPSKIGLPSSFDAATAACARGLSADTVRWSPYEESAPDGVVEM